MTAQHGAVTSPEVLASQKNVKLQRQRKSVLPGKEEQPTHTFHYLIIRVPPVAGDLLPKLAYTVPSVHTRERCYNKSRRLSSSSLTMDIYSIYIYQCSCRFCSVFLSSPVSELLAINWLVSMPVWPIELI